MGKHDDIMLSLTTDKLTELLGDEFGKVGCWSNRHFTLTKPTKDWEIIETRNLLNEINEEDLEVKSLNELKLLLLKSQMEVNAKLKQNKYLFIKKTFEFPLIKGEGQYKVTKGFIDLIVHCKPFSRNGFSCYQEADNCIEFIIEIKKEKDFEDMGSVLRQIKEYREYYNCFNANRWESELSNKETLKRKYCVLSTKIPSEIVKLFSDEDILCLQLDDANVLENKK